MVSECDGTSYSQERNTDIRRLQWLLALSLPSNAYSECLVPPTTTSSFSPLWNYYKECYFSTLLHDRCSAAKYTLTSYSTSSTPQTRKHYNHKRFSS